MAKSKSRDYPLPPSDSLLSYKTPAGYPVAIDTSGYSSGRKKFPIKAEGEEVGLYGKKKLTTMSGTTNRKSVKRAIDYLQGKPYKKIGITPKTK